MKFLEKIAKRTTEGKAVTLKGHAKLTLHDERTGETEVHECDNIITGAVQSILNGNSCGLADMSQLLPLKKLYSGCLLFQEEITQAANNYNLPDDISNPMIANAGDAAAATQSDTRGNPNAQESRETATSLKQVWDWPTSAGNGTIRTVCLVPGATLGNNGTRPISNDANYWVPFAIPNNIGDTNNTTLTREEAMKRPVSISADGQTGKAIWWTGTTFEEITVRKDVHAFGILRDPLTVSEVSSRTATVRSFTDNKANFFEDDDYYYLYEITSATSVKIDKISKSTMAVTQADKTYSDIQLYTGTMNYNQWRRCIPRFAYDGTYLYFPNTDRTTFVAINPNDNSDKHTLDGQITANVELEFIRGKCYIRPIIISSKVILGENYFINGNTVYETAQTASIYSNATYGGPTLAATIRDGAAVYGMPLRGDNNSFNHGQGPVLVSLFLSTIMVLPSPVTKSTSQTMKLEYTLTEVYT